MTLHLDPGVVPHLERLKDHQREDSDRASVKLASQYSIRLYEWAWKWRHVVLKRISIPQIRKVLGVDEVRDGQGDVISEKCLVHWPNLKQRAIDRALNEISEKTDLSIRLVAVGEAKYRRVLSLAFGSKKRSARRNQTAERQRVDASVNLVFFRTCSVTTLILTCRETRTSETRKFARSSINWWRPGKSLPREISTSAKEYLSVIETISARVDAEQIRIGEDFCSAGPSS